MLCLCTKLYVGAGAHALAELSSVTSCRPRPRRSLTTVSVLTVPLSLRTLVVMFRSALAAVTLVGFKYTPVCSPSS
jgi:hypothetical protein